MSREIAAGSRAIASTRPGERSDLLFGAPRSAFVTNIARERDIVFGQVRTQELRNSAQFAQTTHFLAHHLMRRLPPIYGRNRAMTRNTRNGFDLRTRRHTMPRQSFVPAGDYHPACETRESLAGAEFRDFASAVLITPRSSSSGV